MRCKIIQASQELAGLWIIFILDFVEKLYHRVQNNRRSSEIVQHEMAYVRHQKQNQHTKVTFASLSRWFHSLCFHHLLQGSK